jgi:hypothetical protein
MSLHFSFRLKKKKVGGGGKGYCSVVGLECAKALGSFPNTERKEGEERTG